jgi:uncharacterized membrane protein
LAAATALASTHGYKIRLQFHRRKPLSKLGEAKTLGGVGAILLLIPGISIIGYILILIATKYISDDLGDKSIFDNMLYAVITGIIGVAVMAGVLFTGAIFGASTLGISTIAGVIGGLIVIWISLIISSIFIRRAFNTMAARLNVDSFKTAGTLYFIGAILTIILVGFVLLFIAYIFQIIAFFSIHETQPLQPQPAAVPVGQAGMKFCPNCGTQMDARVAFCPKCGAKQFA